MQHASFFDGVRGLAFLIVLTVHGIALCYSELYIYIYECGKYGVWLFFVLSSFLLTKNYIIPNKGKVNYLLGRVTRIVPAYLIACLAYNWFGVLVISENDWLSLLIIQYGALQLWTIPVEFYFYLYLFFIWFITNPILRDVIFFICALTSFLAFVLIGKIPNSTDTYWYLPSFFVGYMLARAWGKIPELKYGFEISVTSIFLFIVFVPGVSYWLFDLTPTSYLVDSYVPISLLWAVFIISVAKAPENFINGIVSSSPLCFLGKISYSGYLFHWLVMVKVNTTLGSGLISFLLSMVLSVLLAFVTFKLIETPCLALKKIVLKKFDGV